jgi:serine/threonine-protein kinase
MKLGAIDFLEKPLRGPTELRILVSRTLERWAAYGEPDGSDQTEQLQRALGRTLGPDFTVGERIGRGGYAMVFRVLDRRLDRQLAAKVLLPEFAAATDAAERFRREARTLAQLTHPNIVPVYFVARQRDVPCFVMPFVEGEPLSALLAREGALALPVVLRIARDVAFGLDFAHQSGVLHRDVKPENILIDASTGRSLLGDFGIAKALAHSSLGTGPGTFVGTPRYMSPEQVTGERDIDARSDIYSLGIVVYEMLAGKPPFDGKSSHKILVKQLTAPAPPMRTKHATPHVQSVIARALAKDPAKRFSSAGAFVFALQVAANARHER